MSPSTESRENREFATELKFALTPGVAERVHAWARTQLGPDPHTHGADQDSYDITSVYFDTPRFDVFRRIGSFGRSKYRIRRYGATDLAFLERKLKTRGLVSKRRSPVPMAELTRLTEDSPDRGWPGYWYSLRLQARRLQPVCQIAYRRAARVALSELGPIRLTLDHDLRAWPTQTIAFNGAHDGTRLGEHVVLELKYCHEIPALFKRLVEDFALRPLPISKYRLAAATLGLVPASIAQENPAAKTRAPAPRPHA